MLAAWTQLFLPAAARHQPDFFFAKLNLPDWAVVCLFLA